MGRYKIKFPCGLEIGSKEFGMELGNLNEEGIVRFIKENGCLIHGKNCPPKNFKKNK